MSALDAIRDALPESARDIKLNLQSVLSQTTLSPAQKWGVAVASSLAARNVALRDAIVSDARMEGVEAAVIDDAMAAAALMAMNNVYYRFRHFSGKESYSQMPARLRMNRLVKPATQRVDFELFSLAVSAINGCESCVKSHERVVVEGGLTEAQVHDAVRIAAVVQATAVSLEMAPLAAALGPAVA